MTTKTTNDSVGDLLALHDSNTQLAISRNLLTECNCHVGKVYPVSYFYQHSDQEEQNHRSTGQKSQSDSFNCTIGRSWYVGR